MLSFNKLVPTSGSKSRESKRLRRFVKILFSFFLFVTFFFTIHSSVYATSYYVDNSCSNNGDGSCNGTSPSCTCASSSNQPGPFSSISNMQAKAGGYSGDDNIYLKKGETFREQLTVPSSGTSGHPITFGAYGSGTNPIIDRTQQFSNWYLWSPFLNDNGFEYYTVGTPNDNWAAWGEQQNGTGTAKADTTIFKGGVASAHFTITTGSANGPYNGVQGAQAYQEIITTELTTYYLSVWGRVSSGSTDYLLNVRVKDASNLKYLDSAGNWQTSAVTIALNWNGAADDTWVEKTISFTTLSGGVDLFIAASNYGTAAGSSWVDNVYLVTGTGESATKVWTGTLAGNLSYYGAINNGSRVISYVRAANISPSAMSDNYFNAPSNKKPLFFYRNDSGTPGTFNVGSIDRGIYVNNVNYVTIDGIDVYGPGGNTTGSSLTNYPIEIGGTADHVIIQNLVASYTETQGIYAPNTSTNITYNNVTAHDNVGTGLYMNSQGGSILNSKSYGNGQLSTDPGDKGGIGSYQGANLNITGNEVYQNGRSDGDGDFEISVVSAAGAYNISKNYIHDCLQGCIQIAEGTDGSTISYNIINGFGSSTYSGESYGKFSGIRIGGGASGAPNVKIYNNVIANGSSTTGNQRSGIAVYLAGSTGTIIKNNIFYNNGVPDISVNTNVTTTTHSYDNNDFYRSDYTNAWNWKGTNYSSLATWQAASLQDSNSLVTDPKFISASDFHLLSSSPAINTGVDVGLTSDYAGTTVPQGSAQDMGAYEYIPLTVTINQKSDQVDPTNSSTISSTINFTVVFSESVSDFATGDITLSGTAGATTATVTGSGTTYNVAVTGMTGPGTVIASISADKATGATGNTNAASTSTDNTVTYDATAPLIPGTPSNASLTTNNKPVWAWIASTDPDSGLATTPYTVQWCSDSSFTSCDLNTDTSTTNSYTQLVALADGTWYFRVKAADAAGNTSDYSSSGTDTINTTTTSSNTSSFSSNNSTASAPSCGDQAPGAKAPWLYGAVAQDSGSVLLYFTEADNPVNKYVLEYGTKSGDYPYGVQDMGVNSRGQMTFLVKSLSVNTTYYFRVRGGNGCATGPWSNEISAKTKGLVSFNQLDITQSELVPKAIEETPKTETCQTYTVKSGDTLWTIAKNLLGDGNKYKDIIEQNKDTYSSLETSNNLRSGWELKINCGKQTKTNETQKTPETQTQGGYDVKVKVINTNKKPVEGAKVTIHSKVQETITNKDGIAEFKNVEAGDHKILIAYNNFEGEQSVNLTGNVKEFDLNVTVQQKAISLSPLAYGIIGLMGLTIIVLIVLLIKNKRKG